MTVREYRVMFISYTGMLDPLGQSQVIPYLRELAKRGVCFTLISFERGASFASEGLRQVEPLRLQLASENIDWHYLRYHQTPSVPATIYDVIMGVRLASKLIKEKRIQLVHARSHIPATIALWLKQRFGIKVIFDVRGLMAEEYVEANHWFHGDLPYRLTKNMERRALAAADGVVTLTQKIWPLIKEWDGLRGREVIHEIIPCCADLRVFRFSWKDRVMRRTELGLGERFTLVYCGSIGGWYLSDKMADLFLQLLNLRQDAHFLWLTLGNAEIINRLMKDRGIKPCRYTILKAASPDVPSYLSASDVGIAFYKPGFSKLATSPVKVTEYLACSLPIIINAGIGDSDALLDGEGVGAVVSEFNDAGYTKALTTIDELLMNPEQTRRRSREVAEKTFDLHAVGGERYARLYERVLAG